MAPVRVERRACIGVAYGGQSAPAQSVLESAPAPGYGRRLLRLVGTSPKSGVRIMKANIHPEYHFITVKMTDGSEYQTRSTYGKEGDTLALDIDPSSHPAWVGGAGKMLDAGGQVARFNKRFSGFGLSAKN
jgi:large subunit ribosomal protein L31